MEDNSEMLRVQVRQREEEAMEMMVEEVRSVRRQFNNTKRIMKHVETVSCGWRVEVGMSRGGVGDSSCEGVREVMEGMAALACEMLLRLLTKTILEMIQVVSA